MRITIKKGRIVDPAHKRDETGDLHIGDGRIIAIGKPPKGFISDRVIDAAGRIVCPGLVDLSARFKEPGHGYHASIASETAAAASAGISTLCCPPDTDPVIDTPAVAELVHQRAALVGKSRVHCIGALTLGLGGETLAGMHALKNSGCIGVSNGRIPVNNTSVLRRALEYAATCDLTVHLSCEDGFLGADGVVHDGAMAVRLGLPGIPETAETIALSRALLLIEQTGASAHFCRITCAASVDMIAQAREKGLPVTADVGIAHLYLTETDLADFNSLCHLRPPLRTLRDRDALRRGITDGVIDAICSDHQPHDDDAKSAPFGLTEPGASTLDTLLPLSLQLVRDKIINLEQVIAALTIRPARIAGIDTGHIGVGATADVCIIDPDREWTVTRNTLSSAGKNSPFLDWEMTGKVTHTLVAGRIVFEQTVAGGP
jgi:dihydroorotase